MSTSNEISVGGTGASTFAGTLRIAGGSPGPGKVLTGLTRRIDKSLQAYSVFDAASLASTQQSVGEN